MTTTFSFSRLIQLIRKHWFENSRLYFFSALALLGLMGLVFTFWVLTDGNNFHEDIAYLIFIGGIFITGAVFASMSFNMLGEKPKGTYWLSFPASHLEKLITVIFYTTIVFTLIYCACFFLVKTAADFYINDLVYRFPSKYTYRQSDFSGGFGELMFNTMCGFFAVQAFYIMGSVYFSKYSFVITTIIGALLIFLFVYYISELYSGNSFGSNLAWQGSRIVAIDTDNLMASTYKSYELSPFLKNLLEYSTRFIWAPVFWVVAWFRLKEKQI